METGIYFQSANAPVCDSGIAAGDCVHNTGAYARKATTLGAEFGVIPHELSIGVAYRSADNGGARGFEGDNAFNLSAVYELFMNVGLHADYAKYSGSAHNGANALTNQYTLMLEAVW